MFKKILKIFAVTQFLLIISWFLGEEIIPFRLARRSREITEFVNTSILWSRTNFDGLQFLQIAKSGHGYLQQVFFPLYPQLISLFKNVFESYTISGLFISFVSFILMLFVLGKLLKEEKFKKSTIYRILLILAFFPTSFYFSVVYTESLFMLLVVLSFYLARKGNYLLAGFVAGLASYTRFIGIFLVPAIVIDYCQQEKAGLSGTIIDKARKVVKAMGFIFISSWGLIAYMFFLKKTTGDPLYFVHIQQLFSPERAFHKLILIYQVFWRYIKMVFSLNPSQWAFYSVSLELVVSTVFLGLLLWGWYKRKEYKIKESWLIFSFLAYSLPTITGTFSSMPRFVLVCFPGFIVIERLLGVAKKSNKKLLVVVARFYLPLSILLLIIISAFFFRGYWVA
jgi:Gpi18-like mannosyltransferase